MHATRSLSSEDPDAGGQVGDVSMSDSQESLPDPQPSAGMRPQEEGMLTVASADTSSV